MFYETLKVSFKTAAVPEFEMTSIIFSLPLNYC